MLAWAGLLRCNAVVFNFVTETASMPPTQQRRTLYPFDARSVMLFAALTMGGALAQAQSAQSAPSASPQPRHLAGSSPAQSQPRAVFGGSAAPSTSTTATAGQRTRP